MCITQSLSVTCFKMDIGQPSQFFQVEGSSSVADPGEGSGGTWAPLFSWSGWPPRIPPLILKVWICHCSFHNSVVGVHDPYQVLNVTHLWVRSQYFPFFDGFNTPCSFSFIRIFIMVLIIIGRVLYLQLAENKLISGMNTELSLWGASLGAWTPSIVSSLTP